MDDMITPLREDFVLMQPHILMGSRFSPAVARVFPEFPALKSRGGRA